MRNDRLADAQRHVERGRLIIERQREIIARQRALGHDTEMSENLLKEFEHSQDIFERDLLAIVNGDWATSSS